ncbi:MAG TPA: phytoene/squalene synthase family protein, partial [Candidatus Acidoferrum sp.]|nr:phytoene/squalene synthase family protein [Candidatus Acidoferrum sp.]
PKPLGPSRKDAVRHLPGPLRHVLKHVSRSFYLTLAVLPSSMRTPLGLAYLLARAADTIADTRILPRTDRLHYLDILRRELDLPGVSGLDAIIAALPDTQRLPIERELLLRLPECFAAFPALSEQDRLRIRDLLLALTHGMQEDLRMFPGEGPGQLAALETRADLDRYTYFAAGCVGEFWTDMAMAHLPALHRWDVSTMRIRGKHFGQGLQMTNVLRDVAQDLRIGRCYLPRQDLLAVGLRPSDLLDPAAADRLQPLLHNLLCLTLSHYSEGWAYLLAIPTTEIRMRLACTWPLLIGLRTLNLIQQARDLLNPQVTQKISRSAVYGIMARSIALAWSNRALDRYYRLLCSRITVTPTLAV